MGLTTYATRQPTEKREHACAFSPLTRACAPPVNSRSNISATIERKEEVRDARAVEHTRVGTWLGFNTRRRTTYSSALRSLTRFGFFSYRGSLLTIIFSIIEDSKSTAAGVDLQQLYHLSTCSFQRGIQKTRRPPAGGVHCRHFDITASFY